MFSEYKPEFQSTITNRTFVVNKINFKIGLSSKLTRNFPLNETGVVHEHPGRMMGSDGESEEASGASDDVAHHHGGHRTAGHLHRNSTNNLNGSNSSATSNGSGAAQQGPVQVGHSFTHFYKYV